MPDEKDETEDLLEIPAFLRRNGNGSTTVIVELPAPKIVWPDTPASRKIETKVRKQSAGERAKEQIVELIEDHFPEGATMNAINKTILPGYPAGDERDEAKKLLKRAMIGLERERRVKRVGRIYMRAKD